MAVTQYIGARYVPVFADPAEWSPTKQYEPLTIVLHQGNSFTSRQFVPIGVEIDNTNYWVETGNYNSQVEQYRQEVLRYGEETESLFAASMRVYKNTADMAIDDFLNVGAICYTLGFRNENDGGGATYIISSNATANAMDKIATRNGVATIVIRDNVCVDCIGAYGDGTNDDTQYISRAIEISQNHKVLFNGKQYKVTSPIIEIPTNTNKMVFLEGVNEASGLLTYVDGARGYTKGTTIIFDTGNVSLIHGTNEHNSKIIGSISNITFMGVENGNCCIFNTVTVHTFKFSNNATRYVTLATNSTFNGVSHISENSFLNCKPFFNNSGLIDSYIHDNYISGNGDDICFRFADCSHSKIYSNFFDFFTIVYNGYWTDVFSSNNEYEVFGNIANFATDTTSLRVVSVNDTFSAFSDEYLTQYRPSIKQDHNGMFIVNGYSNITIIGACISSNAGYIINSEGSQYFYKSNTAANIKIVGTWVNTGVLLDYLNIVNNYQPTNITREPWILIEPFIPVVNELPTTRNFWNGMKVTMNGELYEYMYGWKKIGMTAV